MDTASLDYHLPQELIATRPAEPRDSARLLVARLGADQIDHRHVRDLPDLLAAGDCLVFNNTAVLAARFLAVREDSGGGVEGLFVEAHPSGWRVMLRSNGRLHPGLMINPLGRDGSRSKRGLILIERIDSDWLARPEPQESHAAILNEVGLTPLPPYIRRARQGDVVADDLDRRWYQTTYAHESARESIAAPTAGLHFTPELLDQLAARGVERLQLTLHVGPGTFKPVKAATIEGHPMHEERYSVPAQVLRRIRHLRAGGGRAIAVGTTSTRAIESIGAEEVDYVGAEGTIARSTRILIHPPHEFQWIDGLLTNFHLPRSTLLALVAAMVGLERLHRIYREAIAQRYRFYSYGDAMLILP